jgi:hypothetical protein
MNAITVLAVTPASASHCLRSAWSRS